MTSFAHKLSFLMGEALIEAEKAYLNDEVPVGALIICDKTHDIIARAHNVMHHGNDPTGHAEILAIRQATQQIKTSHLRGYSLIVTLEPCAMCAAAASHARLDRVIFGAYDLKSGGIENGVRAYSHASLHHKPDVIGGILESDCATLMKKYFQQKRADK